MCCSFGRREGVALQYAGDILCTARLHYMHTAMPESQIQRTVVLNLAVLIPERRKRTKGLKEKKTPSMLTIANYPSSVFTFPPFPHLFSSHLHPLHFRPSSPQEDPLCPSRLFSSLTSPSPVPHTRPQPRFPPQLTQAIPARMSLLPLCALLPPQSDTLSTLPQPRPICTVPSAPI